MKARSFFYVCAGVLMLAIAYSIGAERAIGQTGPETVVDIAVVHDNGHNFLYALTNTGQMFVRDRVGQWIAIPSPVGGTIAVDPATMGKVKEKYKDED